jgi:iron complex transport system substrate-binding protein
VVYAANRGETLLLLGDNTVMEGLVEAAGGVDVAPEAGMDGMLALTPEALAGGAPDVIVTTERTWDTFGGGDGFTELPGVAQTPAGRDGRILVYEDLFLLGLGPRTGDLLATMLADFHPDLAP